MELWVCECIERVLGQPSVCVCAHSWSFLMRCEVPASGWTAGIDAWKLLLYSEEGKEKKGVNVIWEEEEMGRKHRGRPKMTLWCVWNPPLTNETKLRPLIFSSFQFWTPCLHAATKWLEYPLNAAQLPVQVFDTCSFKLSQLFTWQWHGQWSARSSYQILNQLLGYIIKLFSLVFPTGYLLLG